MRRTLRAQPKTTGHASLPVSDRCVTRTPSPWCHPGCSPRGTAATGSCAPLFPTRSADPAHRTKRVRSESASPPQAASCANTHAPAIIAARWRCLRGHRCAAAPGAHRRIYREPIAPPACRRRVEWHRKAGAWMHPGTAHGRRGAETGWLLLQSRPSDAVAPELASTPKWQRVQRRWRRSVCRIDRAHWHAMRQLRSRTKDAQLRRTQRARDSAAQRSDPAPCQLYWIEAVRPSPRWARAPRVRGRESGHGRFRIPQPAALHLPRLHDGSPRFPVRWAIAAAASRAARPPWQGIRFAQRAWKTPDEPYRRPVAPAPVRNTM